MMEPELSDSSRERDYTPGKRVSVQRKLPLKQYVRVDVNGKYESTDSSFKSSSCICHVSHKSCT